MQKKKSNNVFEKIYMGIIFVFMYAPILTLIVLSFNSSKSRAKWSFFIHSLIKYMPFSRIF